MEIHADSIDPKEQMFRDIVKEGSYGYALIDGTPCEEDSKGSILVDVFSAQAVVNVLDAINPKNKEKLLTFDITRICDIAFELHNKARRS